MDNIYVVDAPCGAGKTSSAINMINEDTEDNKYMFITPFLKEVDRIKDNCRAKYFFEPQEKGTKLNGIHWLIANDKNIVSTHALFLNFTETTVSLLKQKQYTLILDEVADVVDILDISIKDMQSILQLYAHIENNMLIWDDDEYAGKFSDIMRMAKNGCVGVYNDKFLVWCFPIEIFKVFKNIYIMTYMFDSQIQRYYYDFYTVGYDNLYINNCDGYYKFTHEENDYSELLRNYNKLINILDNKNLNRIGEDHTDLSVSWFLRDERRLGAANKVMIRELRKHMVNYFKNIRNSPSEFNMWTTYKRFKKSLSGGGYSRGFVSVNARATNDYRYKTNLAYCANIFMNPVLKNFFGQKDVLVNEDDYALSELVQWVWRSSIRDGKEIDIYIPSARMRKLFTDWLLTNK